MTNTYALPAGTTVYHGTNSEEEFEELDGPAWVSQERRVASQFVGRHRGGVPRILVFKTTSDLDLVLFESGQDISYFIESVMGYPDDSLSPIDLAHLVCDHGYDGWIVPNNYYESSDDTMLCNPENVLELIGIEEVP